HQPGASPRPHDLTFAAAGDHPARDAKGAAGKSVPADHRPPQLNQRVVIARGYNSGQRTTENTERRSITLAYPLFSSVSSVPSVVHPSSSFEQLRLPRVLRGGVHLSVGEAGHQAVAGAHVGRRAQDG